MPSRRTRYLSEQFLISLVTGILVWSALTLLEIDFALIWGALALFRTFLPTIGSIIAFVPPIVVLGSLLFRGLLWGVVGALLSIVPASAIKIVCDQIDLLRPVGVMMGSG